MRVLFHKQFEKQFKKLPSKLRIRFTERLALYLEDTSNPLLHVHHLKGEKVPLESMNVDADYRALFIRTKSEITFYEIGSHSELYE
jgi:mRNA-degrading endonuclease YafQ of YafQ-DinJ toxin-antitoxin module